MSNKVTFYFDFVSPYSYLAFTRLASLIEETGAELQYVPILLGGLHQAQDVKSPPMIPAKAKWIVRDCHMWAEEYGLPLKWPQQFPFQTLPLLRLCAWLQANQPEKVDHFITETFIAIWQQGLNCHDQADVSKHLHSLGFELEEAMAAMSDPEAKQTVIDNGLLAVEKEMFGLPVFEVNSKLYFGQDRLHFVAKALKGIQLKDGQ